jgi:hypothetical protein
MAFLAALLFLQDLDVPEYKRWASFKPGSSVSYHVDSETIATKHQMDMTVTLVELTPTKAVLETTQKITIAGNPYEVPASRRDAPADAPKPAGPKGEVKQGDEELEIAGQKLACRWIETRFESEGTKTWTKTWWSEKVPGMIVRQESKSEGAAASSMKRWVTRWEQK